MMESAVQLLHLVQSMKVTVMKVNLNVKETLFVGETIVLHLFHLEQIAVNPLLVSKHLGKVNQLMEID